MARGSKKKYTSCRRSLRQMRVVLFRHAAFVTFLMFSVTVARCFLLSTPANKSVELRSTYRCTQPFTMVPPFGCRTWPVMYEESSDARNT